MKRCASRLKQLQRTVTRRRGDGASAPLHYALTPRFIQQRAAAELRQFRHQSLVFTRSLYEWFHGNREPRAMFRRHMTPPPRSRRPRLQVPSSMGPELAGDIGRAYDCWLRISCIVANRLGKESFRSFLGYTFLHQIGDKERRGTEDEVSECMRTLDNCYTTAGVLDDSVLRAAFVLGYLERRYRIGEGIFSHHAYVPPENIDELRKLARASDTSWLLGDVVLNPVFGLEGERGALAGDGDLIVDHTLYEVKTSRELRPLETMRQLLGYVVMNSFLERPFKIDSVAFYYVRFGWRECVPVSQLCTKPDFAALQRFIGRKIGKAPPQPR